MKQYEKIARWILTDCDSPIDEIEWLLEQIYDPKESRVKIDFDKVICPKIEDDYDAVFEQLEPQFRDGREIK
tara:strand:- start:819 stop:1034 length:216 start_codon:yes stop_codon:yes gene_type:complete